MAIGPISVYPGFHPTDPMAIAPAATQPACHHWQSRLWRSVMVSTLAAIWSALTAIGPACVWLALDHWKMLLLRSPMVSDRAGALMKSEQISPASASLAMATVAPRCAWDEGLCH